MELRSHQWLLILLIITGHCEAQEEAAEIFARAESMRLQGKARREAIERYGRAAQLWKGREEEAQARWRRGQLLDLSGEREKALGEFRAGLAQARDPKVKAGLHYGLGRVLQAMGKNQEGIEHYQKSLDWRRQTGEKFEQALSLHNLGAAYWALGENEEAKRRYEEALVIRREIGDEAGIGYTLFGLANVQYVWGDLERALEEYERALVVWRKLKQARGEADCLNSMGLMHALLGDARQARLLYAAALEGWAKAGDAVGEAYTLSNLGMVEGAGGRALFERALRVLREKGDRNRQAYVLHNLGVLDGAPALLEESLAIKREVGDRYGEAQTREKLAEIYLKSGQAGAALESATEAVRQQQAVRNKLGDARAEAVRGRALLKLGRHGEASETSKRALEMVEWLRAAVVNVELRGRFFATQQRVYRDAIAVLMAMGRSAEAFEVSERSRARMLLDRVMAASEGKGENRELAARERQLRREIHVQAQRIQRLSAGAEGVELVAARRQLDRLFETWRRLSKEREELAGVMVKPILARLQGGVLEERTALVEFLIDGDQSWAWAVTRTGIRAVRMASRPTLAALVKKQRVALAGKAEDAGVDRELMRLLIAPLGLGRGIERLAMVLDAPLNQMSFAAVGGLIERYELIETPSASTLIALRERPARSTRRGVEIIADPVFDAADTRAPKSEMVMGREEAKGYRRLHFSGIEAEGIFKIAGEQTASRHTGLEAGKELLEREAVRKARVVHLATHAQVEEERPELSAVVFAGIDGKGRERNGHLRLYEIYRLQLEAELVVLSGCTTAMGPELSGEGTLSLARGFLYAGAGKVMASQWEVDDRATAELMVRFYEGYLRLRLPAAAALRRAQLALRADARWKQPYYWAGFRLAGDWR